MPADTNRLNENAKTDYFRYNIPITIEEACIDNTSQMEEVKRCVQLLPHGVQDRNNAVSALLNRQPLFQTGGHPKI